MTDSVNARNGYGKKNIKTKYGKTEIQVPRDRNSSFEPVLVPKRSQLSTGIENLIVSLYAKGMSNSDIEDQLLEIYDFQVSTSMISKITDKITNDIVAWQNRPLKRVYLIVWMDGIVLAIQSNDFAEFICIIFLATHNYQIGVLNNAPI